MAKRLSWTGWLFHRILNSIRENSLQNVSYAAWRGLVPLQQPATQEMKYFMMKGCEGTLSSQVIASLGQFNGWVHHRDMETWSKVQWFQCFNTCDWLVFNILLLYLTKASNLTSKMETAANNILFTVPSPSVILQIYFIKIVIILTTLVIIGLYTLYSLSLNFVKF